MACLSERLGVIYPRVDNLTTRVTRDFYCRHDMCTPEKWRAKRLVAIKREDHGEKVLITSMWIIRIKVLITGIGVDNRYGDYQD
jgi:hypothetical protein